MALQAVRRLAVHTTQVKIPLGKGNLHTFETTLDTTRSLAARVPADRLLVSESGIKSRADMLYLKKLKINSVLIGEGIVTAKNIPLRIRELFQITNKLKSIIIQIV